MFSLFMERDETNHSEIHFQPHNWSDAETMLPGAESAVLYMLACGAVLLTVCGNLLVIISICHFKQLHTPTNLLLLSLAVTDLLIGLTVMPFHFALIIEICWSFGIELCKVYKMCSFILTFLSAYTVTFIALDRYLAVCYPFFYVGRITINVSSCSICLIWSFATIYNTVLLYFNSNFDNIKNNTVCSVECVVTVNETWGIIDLICTFLIPSSVMIILYTKIFIIAKKHVNAISKQSKDSRKMNSSALSERKAAQKLGILVLAFLLCFIPYFISVFVNCTAKFSLGDIISKTLTVQFMNSCINPIIYSLFYPWYQKSAKFILTCKLHKQDSALLHVLSKPF